jgi:hypothetical protein
MKFIPLFQEFQFGIRTDTGEDMVFCVRSVLVGDFSNLKLDFSGLECAAISQR